MASPDERSSVPTMWWTYVMRVAGTGSPKALAAVTGLDAPGFSKWKSGLIPGARTVAQFARAYQQPVIEAFVAAGFVTEEEAGVVPSPPPRLDSYGVVELLDEVRRRLTSEGERP